MNNADKPATPISVSSSTHGNICSSDFEYGEGLTKREQACLTMGVADTGDAELDAIITKGNKNKFAGLAMQGLFAHYGTVVNETFAVAFADALLKALEQDNE